MLMMLTGLEKEWAQTAPNSFVGRQTVPGVFRPNCRLQNQDIRR